MAKKYKYQKGGTTSCSLKVKGVNVCSLTKRQQTSLQKHAEHHSKKHVQAMVNAMNNGASFTKSHKDAMNKVGK